MILPKQDLLDLTGLDNSVSVDLTHKGVEQEIKNYCGWEIESATYTNVVVDGSGDQWLWPGHKNITALNRVAVDMQAVIKIKHTTASSNAFARVTYTDLVPTSLSLFVDGSATTTKAFADYATMTLLVAQITGSGWSAEIYDTDYNPFASTNLLEIDNLVCGTWDGTDPGWSELHMPGAPVSGIKVERSQGGLYRASGWPSGVQNIPLTYTAGWTTANMPGDLKQSVVLLVQFFYRKHQEQTTGIKSFSLRNLQIEYATATADSTSSSIPIEVLDVLDDYRIKVIV